MPRSPSTVSLPPAAEPYPSLLDFLCRRFPAVGRAEWKERLEAGKVLDEEGRPVGPGTPYAPGARLRYFRENPRETPIPCEETILFQDAHLLAVDKPPFLPVVPAGRWVEECLLARLRKRTGIGELAPLHRLDRLTSGVVLFSADPATRGRYADLFRLGRVERSYEALSAAFPPPGRARWEVADRLERGEPWFLMRRVTGEVNARTGVEFAGAQAEGGRALARFALRPLTGRKHQLRVHMAGLGFPIENDPWYPELAPEGEDDLARPLRLLARSVRFEDPLTGRAREFASPREGP